MPPLSDLASSGTSENECGAALRECGVLCSIDTASARTTKMIYFILRIVQTWTRVNPPRPCFPLGVSEFSPQRTVSPFIRRTRRWSSRSRSIFAIWRRADPLLFLPSSSTRHGRVAVRRPSSSFKTRTSDSPRRRTKEMD